MSVKPPGRQSLSGCQGCLLPVFTSLCNFLHLHRAGPIDLLLKTGDKTALRIRL